MFNNEKQRFSLRKLSVGLASVCIGITFISVKQDTVKADTINAKTNIVTAQSVNPDVQKADTQKADTQKELLKNTDVQDGVKQTEPIDKTSASNTPRDQATNGVAKENLAVSEQLENKENNVDNIDVKRQNELHVSTGDNQLNTTPENKQALETSLLKDTTKPETTNTFYVRKSNMQANVNALRESKAVALNINGGFDEATWGKLDVNNWQGQAENGVYQLTGYTGDSSHVIVPNAADFEQAGKSTNGLQVGITRDNVYSFLLNHAQTIAFSKTSNQKVKAIGTDWSDAFAHSRLNKFDGSNLDVSNVTDMSGMFESNSISDLTSLADWDTSNVTDMSGMFVANKISNLTPLINWDTSKVTNMRGMFAANSISDLTPLANWNISKVTDMSSMLANNPDLIDLKPIANWNISGVENAGGLFVGASKLNLININNTPLMQGFLKTPHALRGTTFITNNADLVKAVVDQDLPTFTNIATRTIVFNFPNGTHETVNQIINYKTIAPVQIAWPIYSLGGGGFSSGAGSSTVIGGHGSSSGGFHYTLGGGGFSSGTGSSVVIGSSGSFSGKGGNRNIISHRMIMAFANAGAPVQPDSDGPKIIKTYPLTDVKASDWQLDTSKQNDDVIIDGVICFKPVKIPHVNGYKAHLMKDPVNPTAFLVSFMAVPEQLQNNQSSNVKLPQKSVQSEQKQSEQKQSEQKQSEQKQSEQKQPASLELQVPIEPQQEMHTLIPDNTAFTNITPDNQLTWKIVNNPNNVTYNLTNTIYKLRLPKFTNYSLRLVKRGTTQNSISFVYTNKTQKLDYVFNLKIQDNKYYLTVGKIDRVNRKIIPIKTSNVISYQDLLQIIAKYFK